MCLIVGLFVGEHMFYMLNTNIQTYHTQLLPRHLIPKPADVKALVAWGGVAGFGALWLIQVCMYAIIAFARLSLETHETRARVPLDSYTPVLPPLPHAAF